jgi:hypothetical protein
MALKSHALPPVVRASGADDMTFLLQDLAPELALRWTARTAVHAGSEALSPALYRGLVSTVLRAASREDAMAALDVLNLTSRLRQEAPLARLGATVSLPPAVLHDVLIELLESTLATMPLETSGKALSFYNTAGVGSSDEAEYEGVADGDSDTRTKFRARVQPLKEVRARNVYLVVEYFSAVLNDSSVATRAFTDAMTADRRKAFWTLFHRTLPQSISFLLPDALRAVQALYSAVINHQTEFIKEQIVTELITAFNDASRLKVEGYSTRPSPALGAFARALPCSVFRITACARFFVQVCGENVRGESLSGSDFKSMDITRFTRNFVEPLLSDHMSISQQTSVPALLVALAEAWMHVGTTEQFRVDFNSCKSIISSMNNALVRLTKHKAAVPHDVMALRVVFLAIGSRVIKASPGKPESVTAPKATSRGTKKRLRGGKPK